MWRYEQDKKKGGKTVVEKWSYDESEFSKRDFNEVVPQLSHILVTSPDFGTMERCQRILSSSQAHRDSANHKYNCRSQTIQGFYVLKVLYQLQSAC